MAEDARRDQRAATYVDCPVCGEPAGARCRAATPRRGVKSYPHSERCRRANKALTELKALFGTPDPLSRAGRA